MENLNLATHDPITSRTPSVEDVRAELERILSSPHLEASDRRRAFLRFIVEETLSGRADGLKGYTVAVTVFGRDETFDAQADPVVRLEARRLRRDLDSYYVDAGSRDAVRISIPKGSYVPRFEWQETPQPQATPNPEQTTSSDEPAANVISDVLDAIAWIGRAHARKWQAAALVAAIIGIAAASWILINGKESSTSSDSLGEPAVVVLPFEALGSTADSRYLADGIGQELINDLMQFPGFRVYTLPIDLEKDANPETVKPGSDLGVAYVVRGNVYADTATIRVAAQMFNAVTGRVLWTGSYDRPLTPEALIRVQSDLSGEIATILGQPYGVVNDDLKVRLAPAVSNMQSYVCVLRAYGYRRSFARAEFDPVLQCLEEAVRRDPDYSDAWAMLGWLYLDAGRYGFSRGGNAQEEYKKAVEASSQAVTLEPNNPLALKALAAVDYYIGRYDESERLTRQALKLNPYDPETLAQLGWRLAARGKFAEGIPTLERAIQRSVNPPGWYFHLIAIDLFLKGDYKQMLRTAERSAVDGSDFSQALLAIANGELGDVKATQAALEKMSASKPLARDFAAFLRLHGATDEIVNALTEGLQKARRVASKS